MKSKTTRIIISIIVLFILLISSSFFFTFIFEYLFKTQVNTFQIGNEEFSTYMLSFIFYLFESRVFRNVLITILLTVTAIFTIGFFRSYSKNLKRLFLKRFLLSLFVLNLIAFSISTGFMASFYLIKSELDNEIQNFADGINAKEKESYANFKDEEIIEYLNNSENSQFEFNDDEFSEKVITRELFKSEDYGDFYAKYVEKYYFDLNFPEIYFTSEDTVIYDGTLFINDFTADRTPVYQSLAKTFVKDYINKEISEPSLTIINKDEYVKKREAEIDGFIKEYDEYIEKIKQSIEQRKIWIAQDEAYIQSYGGEYWQDMLELDQEWLEYYEEELVLWQELRDEIAQEKELASFELGLFVPPNEIDVVLIDQSNYPTNMYIATLIHEYFHYISYSEETYLPDFWEEGITEYLTEKVINEKLGFNDHYTYVNIVPIIEEFVNDVGEEKILEIYFSKNNELAENVLKETYGENFLTDYEDMLYYLTYMSQEEAEPILDEIYRVIK